jgi:TolB protein
MTSEGKELLNLTDNKAQDTSPAWHPSGKKLAFVSTRAGGSDIFVLDVK